VGNANFDATGEIRTP